jgi:hypothetical protein
LANSIELTAEEVPWQPKLFVTVKLIGLLAIVAFEVFEVLPVDQL